MKIVKVSSNRAPIILLHGEPGMGKTTLASKAPSPVAFLLERGLSSGVSIDAVSDVSSSEVAMRISLSAAAQAGAEVMALSGVDCQLPMYAPEVPIRTPAARGLVQLRRTVRRHYLSSPSYHGSLSGMLNIPLGLRPSLHWLRSRVLRFVRRLHSYYGGVRLLVPVHHLLRLLAFPMRTIPLTQH